ncbi:MAG: hypothetical protein BWY71_02211 [Planctomycetes bacterium ADurb.Bin412]|nr:MAG: hypothetical protein BWY71_02211 [Planctomycetes bacterium ADurb.Bin412]
MVAADLGRFHRFADGAAEQVPGKGVFVEGKQAVHHGNVYILPLAGFLPVKQRPANGQGGVHRSGHIADGYRRDLRIGVLVRPSARPLGDHVVSRLVTIGAPVAETGNGTINDILPHLPDRLIIKLQTVHHPGGEVFNQHIAFAYQVVNQLHALGMLQIYADAFFPPVAVNVVGALGDPLVGLDQGEMPLIGPFLVFFHLDNVRPHVRQRARGEGAGQHPGEIQNGNSV